MKNKSLKKIIKALMIKMKKIQIPKTKILMKILKMIMKF